MNEKELNDFIHFSDQKDYIENTLGKEEWITVYQKKKQEKNEYTDDLCFYSCLVSEERKRRDYKEDSSWIMTMDSGRPGIVEHYSTLNFTNRIKRFISHNFFKEFYMNDLMWGTLPYEKEKLNQERRKKNPKTLITKYEIKRFLFKKTKHLLKHVSKKIQQYYRFGEEGIEPLVHVRLFEFSNYPSYIEISEDFRHYFDLYEDSKNNKFLSADRRGNPIEVIKIIDNKSKREVKIKKKYIDEFLFVKKMYLCVQFDHRRWVNQSLLKKSITQNYQSPDGNLTYSLNSGNSETIWNGKNFIKFTGRKFIKYNNVKFLWYEQEKKYEEFSFIDEDGEEQSFTCEENKLANSFGKNEDSPDYLKPISFRKDVLKKYYDKPDQYSVSDRYLNCEGFWGIEIDILDDRVSVFLGDLSKLPYEEQKYWRSYNITEKAKISRVNYERSFEGKFAETDRPDFSLKNKYKEFNQKWKEKYGWSFFKPLSEKDKHYFNSLRIPLNEEQLEFDSQVLSLTKVFIDSIDVKKIKKTFPTSYEKESKTIDILDQWLQTRNIKVNPMLEFLRKLQKLRSKGAAHTETDEEYTKALDYFKQLKGIKKPDSKSEVFFEILIRCIWTIRFLTKYFLINKKQ